MTRNQAQRDAMLRHLGAAYYESLHGRASAADVARARAAVEESMDEHPGSVRQLKAEHHRGTAAKAAEHHGRWHSTVRDVMTTDVVTVDRITTYKEIANLLAKHKISAVPVLVLGRHVAGVVSEDDLLTARDRAAQHAIARTSRLPWSRRRAEPHAPLTAAELMSSPAITIHPDAPIPKAARLMHTHSIKRLPVVDPDGKLIGIVSRADLLSVFLRTDSQIAQEVRELLTEILFAEPDGITVGVRDGVVTLSGQPSAEDQHDLISVVVRLIWDIDGVIDVVDKLSVVAPTSS
jgi:CBS domain-containing protein